MEFFTTSRGISKNRQIATLLKTHKLRLLSFLSARNIAKKSVFVGWGYKPNTQKIRAFAADKKQPYWALEDGFISWLNHPSQAQPSERLSYIIDKTGMYYDASNPSGLDVLLEPAKQTSRLDAQRIDRLKSQLLKLKVSKYNQVRAPIPSELQCFLDHIENAFTLLVDQTFNDASIEFSGGGKHSFKAMFDWGLEKLISNPRQHLVLKVHPDVILGKKTGYLFDVFNAYQTNNRSSLLLKRIHILTDDVNPHDFISYMDDVATVSSQLGFEALWQDKQVHCFAWPFYAGRGLTVDHNEKPLTYSRLQVDLAHLLHAALIEYPTYLHPDSQLVCEIEDILNYMQAHFFCRDLSLPKLNINDVSLWKRSFIPEFLTKNIQDISFNQTEASNSKQLYWGMKQPEKSGWRMEDGFIRSVGLGADLRRPSSLVLDDKGIYYNGKKASRLESLLNQCELNSYELKRADKLISLINESAITKYNVDAVSPYVNQLKQNIEQYKAAENAKERTVILVTGQFQKDLSMQFGALHIKDNLSLLRAVRADYSDAFIIYKEHPDVYSGVRPGRLNEADVMAFADEYVTDVAITEAFDLVDRVCTICSLAGFEALLRGLKVSTYGLPFYGGWGLTEDKYSFDRRTQPRNVHELLYITLVAYSRYVNWNTRKITTVESCICQLVKERETRIELKSSWFSRQLRKMHYLSQALLDKYLFSNSVLQYFKRRCR